MSGSIVKHEDASNAQVSHASSRQRRLRSVVWNDFTKEFKEDGSDIATCNHCKRKFTGASRSGTTHLRNHLRFCASYERAKRKKLVVVRAQSSQLDVKNDDEVIMAHEEDINVPVHGVDSGVEVHEADSASQMAENVSNIQLTHVSPIIRRRRLRSIVWNDFTKEQREDGSLVAICNHCRKQMAGGSSSGTTHLKKHLANCVLYQRTKMGNLDVGKPLLTWVDKTKDQTADRERPHCDQELIQQDLAHMIILHGYPFSIVNHVGFRTFVKDLQPQFKLPSSCTLEENCMAIYESKRHLLYEVLNKIASRVNITVDGWSLSADVGYVCLSCHFIDDDWKLQKKVINFWHVESHEGERIAKLILEKLCEWNIDRKLFSVVLDSSSTSDKVAQELIQSLRPKQSLLLDGENFHVRSCSHILNLIVQDGLEVICEVIKKIRDSVKFVRSSHARLERFQAVAKQVGAPQKSLLIDVPSRWTTTYLMIETACEFQDAFFSLAESDSEYIYAPSSVEWDNVKSVNECLRVFYQMTEKVSSSKSPTANHCFNSICGIHLSLRSWSTSSHPLVSSVAIKMLEQFEKYWGVTSIIPAAASILDPRYKMKSVEYFFKLIYADESEAEAKIENVLQALKNLFNEYAVQADEASSSHRFSCKVGSSIENSAADCIPNGVSKGSSHNPLADLRFGLDQYLQETSSCQPIKSDLDLYLEEAMHPLTKGHDDDFDILAWWRHNAVKYPVLSAMTRDILGIPLSIAFQDSCFSSRGTMLDHYRSSMNPETLQSLICAQDWMRGEIEESALDGLPDGLSTIFTVANLEGGVEGYAR